MTATNQTKASTNSGRKNLLFNATLSSLTRIYNKRTFLRVCSTQEVTWRDNNWRRNFQSSRGRITISQILESTRTQETTRIQGKWLRMSFKSKRMDSGCSNHIRRTITWRSMNKTVARAAGKRPQGRRRTRSVRHTWATVWSTPKHYKSVKSVKSANSPSNSGTPNNFLTQNFPKVYPPSPTLNPPFPKINLPYPTLNPRACHITRMPQITTPA